MDGYEGLGPTYDAIYFYMFVPLQELELRRKR